MAPTTGGKLPISFWLHLSILLFIVFQSYAQVSPARQEHVIHVKFKEQFSPASAGSNRIISFGMKPLDRLNKQNNVSVITRLFPKSDKFEQAHRAFGLHLWYEIRMPKNLPIGDVLRQYKSFSYFESVEERKAYSAVKYSEVAPMALESTTSDPLFSAQWHFRNTTVPGADISLVAAWKMETGDRDVIVAVIDGGIDATHPDLRDAMWTNDHEVPNNGIDDDQNGYVDDLNGFNFGDNTATIFANKHATHIAGTIGAVTNNRIGVAGIAGGSGSADGVRLMSCVGFGIANDGGFETAMVYAADNGAVISQNSWGGGSSAIEAAIDYFIARAGMDNTNANFNKNIQTGPMAGGIVIFAAGNSGSNDPDDAYPASLDKVMAVASTDIRDDRSSFSNFGSWVDLAAPGTDVFSTFPEYNGSYGTISGTSMSCPHVSGVAALIVSKYKGASLKPSFVRSQLLQSCDHVPSAGTGALGAGRLNAARALLPLDVTAPGQITDLGYQVLTQNSITLSWTAPGSDGQSGTATKYDVRYSIYPITEENFTTWSRLATTKTPAAAGNTETYLVPELSYPDYYFAVKTIDFFGNTSSISNVLHVTLPGQPPVQLISSSLTQNIYAGKTAVAQLNVANIAAIGSADLTIRSQTATNYPWLKTDTQTFAAHAASSTNVPIYLDARDNAAVTSQGTVVITTNDPAYTWNAWTVNVTMNVTPAPSLELNVSNVAFGNTYVLQHKDTFIQVYNRGNLPLHIGNITSTNSSFSATVSQSVLAPGMIGLVQITMTPPDQSQQSGIITIPSDDPVNPGVTINVSGKGVPAPSVASSVAAINLSLNPGENTTVPITISNQGNSNFNWRAIISAPGNYTQSENEVFAVGDVIARASSPVEMSWLTTDPTGGFIYAMGSDHVLYLYKPSLNAWTALGTSPSPTIGAGVYMNDKIYSFTEGSPRAMVIYGLSTRKWELIPATIDATNVTSDGTRLYVAAGNKLYSWDESNTWTQLASVSIFYGLGGMVYSKGIIYSHLTSTFTGNGNTPMMKYYVTQNTWQEAKELTGKTSNSAGFDPTENKYYVATEVDTQIAIYDLETDTWTKKTDPQFTGLNFWIYSNAIGASGIYMTRISSTDFIRMETSTSLPWISVAPSSGSLIPGSDQNLNVRVDARTLTGGVYRGFIKFGSVSNSNVNALVPVKLTVTGAPNLVIANGSFLIRPTFVNEEFGSYIELRNTGTALLRVTSITSDNSTFTTDISSIDLEPGQRKTVFIYFNPLTAGTQLATLTFASNDADQPLMTMNVSAVGAIPPIIGLSPSSLNITTFAGSLVKRDVTVSNTGGSDLEINSYGTSPSTFWLSGSDGGELVAPGATRVIKAIVLANLPPGTYTDHFAVSHHSDRFETTIPVTLTVTSAPGIFPESPSFDFGSAYINEGKTRTVFFWNYGDQSLNVSAVDASDSRLILGSWNNVVMPGGSLGIPVTFRPTAVGDFNGQITITSNDPDDGVFIYQIKGKGVTRPHVQLDAVSLTAGLSSGDVVTKHVMLKNMGGSGLTWSAAPQFNSSENTWMSLSPSGGTIGPGDQTDITVSLNMQGLSTGSFSGKISFTTNADNAVVLPVTINTTDTSPMLQADPVVSFAGIAQHKTSSKWNIRNTGLRDLTWAFMSIPEDVTPNKSGGTLSPGQSDQITFYLDRLPDAGSFHNSIIVKSNDRNKTSTFTVSAILSPNQAPDLSSFHSGFTVKVKDPPLSISLKEIRDPEGDPFSVATATQYPAIAEASISNNFLIIKPVSVGNTQMAIAASDAYGAQSQMIFNVVVLPGGTVTGLEAQDANPVKIAASPNPFDKKITINFEQDGSMPAVVSMYDSNGRIVWEGNSTTGEVTIENANLAAGLYLIRIMKDGRWYGSLRVLKQ